MTITPKQTLSVGAISALAGGVLLFSENGKRSMVGTGLMIGGGIALLFGYSKMRKAEMNTKG